MIDPVRWREDNAVMASLAKVVGLDMSRVLPDCGGAVVAAKTVAGDVDVIEVGGHPSSRSVAIVTGISAGDMRRVLTHCDGTVVTTRAGANNLRVIHPVRRHEQYRIVAVLAGVGGLNVGQRLTRTIHAVVAPGTVARDARVVENRRYPAIGLVTVLALFAGSDVVQRLARRLKSIVARGTASGDARVIHESDGLPSGSCVAVDTGASSHDMVGRFLRGLGHAVR